MSNLLSNYIRDNAYKTFPRKPVRATEDLTATYLSPEYLAECEKNKRSEK